MSRVTGNMNLYQHTVQITCLETDYQKKVSNFFLFWQQKGHIQNSRIEFIFFELLVMVALRERTDLISG